MIVCLNGQFVPEEQALVSVFDRGFLYGDGLFETMRVCNGRVFRWNDHLARLGQGASFLRLRLPRPAETLIEWALELIARNHLRDGLMRLTLSRGVGVRGYSPKGADQPSLAMSLHTLPKADRLAQGLRLITSSVRLPANEPLARFKTCNKLPQIIARAEAEEAGANGALLLNTEGRVVEACSGNLFWIKNGTVCTSPGTSGILPGVTRKVVIELCAASGIHAQEVEVDVQELRQSDGVFLTLSSAGIVSCASLDQQKLNRSDIVLQLASKYGHLLENETTES